MSRRSGTRPRRCNPRHVHPQDIGAHTSRVLGVQRSDECADLVAGAGPIRGRTGRWPARSGRGARCGRLAEPLAELNGLVGLAEVKREVATLVRLHQMAERRTAATRVTD